MYKIEDGKLVFFIEEREKIKTCICNHDDDNDYGESYVDHEFANHTSIIGWVDCVDCGVSHDRKITGFIYCECGLELFIGNYVYASNNGWRE